MAGLALDGSADPAKADSTLFAGMKLWLSHNVPQRQYFIEKAKANGAQIVSLETRADVRLVDHARKNQPPGTHSYRFLELSLRNGVLANLHEHAIGPASRAQRPVGSTVTAPKRTKTPFTEADDQFLWDQVEPYRRAGGNWKGNAIYMQLEDMDPRHTYQSWRDRFIKYVIHQNRRFTHELQNGSQPALQIRTDNISNVEPKAGHVRPQDRQLRPADSSPPPPAAPPPAAAAAAPPPPPAAAAPAAAAAAAAPPPSAAAPPPAAAAAPPDTPHSSSHVPDALTPESQSTPDTHRDPLVFSPSEIGAFSIEDACNLYRATRHVLNCTPEERKLGWTQLADRSSHSAHDWSVFFNHTVLPKYYTRHPRPNRADDQGDAEEGCQDQEQHSDVKTCVKCLTSQSDKWHPHPKRGLLCSECGRLSKELGVMRPLASSDAAIERDVGTHSATTSLRAMVDRASSPIYQPSPESVRCLPPQPDQHIDAARSATPPLRRDPLDPLKTLPQTPPTLLGKRRRPSPDPSLEIPATPDQRLPQRAELRHPSPQLQSPQLSRRLSPIFELSTLLGSQADNADPEDTDNELPPNDGQMTSPMMIKLVSDSTLSLSSAHNRELSDLDTSSVSDFGTPTNHHSTKNNWHIAPDIRSSPDFETASTYLPLDSAATARSAAPPVPVIDLTDDLSLPPPDDEPDWLDDEEIEQPQASLLSSERNQSEEEEEQNDDEYTGWKANHRDAYKTLIANQDDLDAILQLAIVSTSFDFDIADCVVKAMVRMYATANSPTAVNIDQSLLPDNIPGCWTPEDDRFLHSPDYREGLKYIRRKHGISSCEDRCSFLQAYNEG